MLARARECTKVGSSRGKHVCFPFDHPNLIRVSVDELLCRKDGYSYHDKLEEDEARGLCCKVTQRRDKVRQSLLRSDASDDEEPRPLQTHG